MISFTALSSLNKSGEIEELSYTLQKCVGNSGAQVVKFNFLLNHNLPNQDVIISGVEAFHFYVPNNQPRKIKMEVKSILPRVSKFSTLVLTITVTKPEYKTVEVTLRDVPITWKY